MTITTIIPDGAVTAVKVGRFTPQERRHEFPTVQEARAFAVEHARHCNGQIEDYTGEALVVAFNHGEPGFWSAGVLDDDGVGHAWTWTPLDEADTDYRQRATELLEA